MALHGNETQSVMEVQVKTEYEEEYEDDLDLIDNRNPIRTSDWKLNPNVECRVIVEKLKIYPPGTDFHKGLQEEIAESLCKVETSEIFELSEFQRIQSLNLKFQLLVEELFELSSRCEVKCTFCEEYVQKLHDHVIQTHEGHPNYGQADSYAKYHNSESPLSVSTSFKLTNPPTTTTTIAPQYKSSTDDQEFQISVTKTQSRNDEEVNREINYSSDDVKPMINSPLTELDHVNHFNLIQMNLKEETEESVSEEDPLLNKEISNCNSEDFTEIVLSSDDSVITETGMGSQSNPIHSDHGPPMQTHTGQKPFKCDQCPKAFTLSWGLKRHTILHTGDKRFKCEVCGKGFGWLANLTQHKRLQHEPLGCRFCGKSFLKMRDLNTHMKTHKEHNMLYKCKTCGKRFHRNDNLCRHELIHTKLKPKPYKCEICERTFLYRCNLKRHKLLHSEVEQFNDEICEKTFIHPNDLNPSDRPMMNSSLTGFEHVNHFSLIQANLKKETEESAPHEDPLRDQEISNFNSQDDFIDTVLSSGNAVKTRTVMANQSDPNCPDLGPAIQNRTGLKRFKCDQCGKGFKRLRLLNLHQIFHTGEKKFKCEMRGKGYGLLGNLNRHKLSHTGVKPVKPYNCEICGNSFLQKSHLTIHLNAHALKGPASSKCGICGRWFFNSRTLHTHESMIHPEVQRFKCEICEKTFLDPSDLNTHRLVHPEVKSFKCNICFKCFPRSDELYRHKLSHRRGEVLVQECDMSGQGFLDLSQLNK